MNSDERLEEIAKYIREAIKSDSVVIDKKSGSLRARLSVWIGLDVQQTPNGILVRAHMAGYPLGISMLSLAAVAAPLWYAVLRFFPDPLGLVIGTAIFVAVTSVFRVAMFTWDLRFRVRAKFA